MFPCVRFRSLAYIITFILFLSVYIHLLSGGNQSPIPTENGQQGRPIHESTLSKEQFIEAAIKSATVDDYDDTAIRAMCDAQDWNMSVVFTCRGTIGGVGNIRQELLHCLRYAIDAGAGLILPVLNIRAENELSDLTNGTASMDYLFDQTRFLSRLNSACPKMVVYKDLDDLKRVGPVTETDIVDVKKISHWFRDSVYSVRTQVQQLKAPAGEITLIPFDRVWRHFAVCHDPTNFADNFSNLLPFRPDVHRLAASALYSLSTSHHLALDTSNPTTSPAAPTFLGIHLRTANDILPYWLNYTDQVTYYLAHINASLYLASLPVIYVASGNASSILSFEAEMKSLAAPRPVVTKTDLLSGEDLAELSALTWDQQALVDMLILNRSAFFMGMADSSFAWTLASQRRRFTVGGTCVRTAGWWKSRLWGTAFEDAFSDLMGNTAYGWEYRMWP